MWECFGLNPIDVWDLDASHFFALAKVIDRKRTEDKKQARRDRE